MECGRTLPGIAGYSAQRSRPHPGRDIRWHSRRSAGAWRARSVVAALCRKPAWPRAVDDGTGPLRDIGYGQWEGLTLPEMELHDAATFASRNEDKWGVAAPSGESYASVTVRVREWFDSLVADTVAVAHGGTMRALMVALGIASPLEAAETPIGQGVVYIFSDGGMRKYG